MMHTPEKNSQKGINYHLSENISSSMCVHECLFFNAILLFLVLLAKHTKYSHFSEGYPAAVSQPYQYLLYPEPAHQCLYSMPCDLKKLLR